jgi:hypothetical protein
MSDVTYGWDASNYDDPPTQRDGIDFYTHKVAEGHHFYRDMEFASSIVNALNLGIPVLGGYFVNHPGTQEDQVDWYIQLLNQDAPWWRQHPCFVHQIDAEKFSYMDRAPTPQENQQFANLLVSKYGIDPGKVIGYCPEWLYGNSLAGIFTYRLWASNYGSTPYVHYPLAYPGNDSSRWRSYSGQSPLILQYGSNTTIGNQTTCDANGFRGTLHDLMTTLGAGLGPSREKDMPAIVAHDPSGSLVVVWTTDDGMVWENIVRPETEAAWIAATGCGARAEVPNVGDLCPNVNDAVQARANRFAAGVTKGIEDAGLTGGSGGGGGGDHTHNLPAGTTGPATPAP